MSPEFKNEFQQTQYSLVFPNSDDMTISQGSKDFAAGLYEHIFGINPLAEVEKERQKAAKERQRAQEERQRINNMILALYHEFQMPIKQIAKIANQDPSYIEDLIAEVLLFG